MPTFGGFDEILDGQSAGCCWKFLHDYFNEDFAPAVAVNAITVFNLLRKDWERRFEPDLAR